MVPWHGRVGCEDTHDGTHSLRDEVPQVGLVKGDAFVAIRFGDHMGLKSQIPDLAEGQPIEMQGEYIDANHAYPSTGNPGDAVLHFTHHPVGYVLYHGQKYS